ncbi:MULTISPECIES: alpha/beta hydrolase [unclassified Mycobacterium]|uniref:putative alpha/beta hydrolase n=1 Tax=unclassified Mycobacterium TaxID=2642494 RepID=UPI0006DC8BE6|nr:MULTISPECIES: alpha/beta hydrolase [unclassified Mycobacterium]
MQLRCVSIAALVAEAGGDPWAINQSLQAGSPRQISNLAEAFRRAARCTREANAAFEQARKRFDAAWDHPNGDHPINDSTEVRRVTRALGAQSLRLPSIAVDLENIAATLAEAQKTATGEMATLDARLHHLDDVIGRAIEMEKTAHLGAADNDALDALVRACEDDAVSDTTAALTSLRSLRAGYSATLRDAVNNLGADGSEPEPLPKGVGFDQVPPPGTDAADVHRWWTSLTPERRQWLIDENPDRIGNLNGVPVPARSNANIAAMTRDLDRVRDIAARAGTSVADVMRDPARFGLSATDVTRYRNANETKQGLDHDAVDEPNPTYLFTYDPLAFGGKGRAAIAIGNPDTARNTAVIVPGTGSSVRGGWLRDAHDDAINLFAQANAADPGKLTAVIAWMGYDTPDDFSDVERISTPKLARAGGAALARDVNGLWTTHLGTGQHVTVLGHSYGATTVADAFALHGMHANDAVLLGCPGTDAANSARDFHLDGGHVFVGDASTDPVGMLGQLDGLSNHFFGGDIVGQVAGSDPGLGADPATDGFGSVRFRAEVPGSDGIDPLDHSHYYHPGSEALHAMADIVSGHGEALEADGLTAGHRSQVGGLQLRIPGLAPITVGPHTPAILDPEWARPRGSVTDNHFFDAQHHH